MCFRSHSICCFARPTSFISLIPLWFLVFFVRVSSSGACIWKTLVQGRVHCPCTMLPLPNDHSLLGSHQTMLNSRYLMQAALVKFIKILSRRLSFCPGKVISIPNSSVLQWTVWTLGRLLEKQWDLANETLHRISFDFWKFLLPFLFSFQLLLKNFELGKQKAWVENV